MKVLRKVVALSMAVLMVLGASGCGKNEGTNGNGDVKATNGGKPVEIAFWNSGMGTEYLDKMIETFNGKQSDWFVYYNASSDSGALSKTFGLEDVDTVDLYMLTKIHDTSEMEPLDDVLESVADGDSKTIKEKFTDSYLAYEKAPDDHYYTLTWGGGTIGIVYNKELFKEAGITTLPRTTNELAVICDTLKSAGKTPFTHHRSEDGESGYWGYMQDVWAAQYDSIDYYQNTFYACKDEQGNTPSKDVLTRKDGRYQVLKAMERFITPDYVLNGSNSQDHITSQSLFINGDVAMMASGSWMANEMKTVGKTDNYGVMKTPVISSITDKLTTVKSDTELRNLISAIDEVVDGTADISAYKKGEAYEVKGKSVSEEDWEYVRAARTSVATNNAQQVAWVPTYSDAIDGAKEFLKFYYSDEGYQIFVETTHVVLPLQFSDEELDMSSWNSFETDIYNIYASAEHDISRGSMTKHRLFTDGGAHPYTALPFLEYYCSNNPNDRRDADEIWEMIVEKIDDNFEQWCKNIQ